MWRRKYIRLFRVGFWAVLLWLIFTFGCYLAPIIAIAIFFPGTRKFKYIQRFVRAADRLCAAMLGFSGRQMISTELIHATHLEWMRNILDDIAHRHCEESAYEEGAYCRLSEKPEAYRTLGCK
jgi:hypothetical protein